jgi:hypothetical protein
MDQRGNRAKKSQRTQKKGTGLWVASRYSLNTIQEQPPAHSPSRPDALPPANKFLELADTAMTLWQHGQPKKSTRKLA